METNLARKTQSESIIRKCHVCGTVNESKSEVSKCQKCNKSFLPLNYFSKIHDHSNSQAIDESLFLTPDELAPEDMIKGITVIW